MKQKKKPASSSTINKALVLLETAHQAIEQQHNYNLAEVWLGEYFERLPKKLLDQRIAKNIYDGLREQQKDLILAGIEAEIERLRILKVKELRKKIIRA